MRVVQERSNTERENRYPEVDQIRRPERQRHVEQHQQRPHPEVYAWTGEAGKQDAERYSGRRESTASGNVSGASKRQVVQDGVRVYLRREHLEHGRERHELFAQAHDRSPSAAFNQLCRIELMLCRRI